MAGGLELATDTSTGAPPAQATPAGGLDVEMGTSLTPADLALHSLRIKATGLPAGAIDAFAQRANPGSYPTWEEIQREMRPAMAERDRAAAQTGQMLRNPPINRSIPYFKAGAAMLQPTRTGNFAESLGYGLGGWASGLEEQNKAELDFAARAANHNYTSAKEKVDEIAKMQGLGLHAGQIGATLELLGRRLETAAEKYARELGAAPGSPDWKRYVNIYEYLKGLQGDQLVEAHAALAKNPRASASDLAKVAISQKMQKEVLADAQKNTFRSPEEKDIWVRNEMARRLQEAEAAGVSSPNALPAPAGGPPAAAPSVQPQSSPAPAAPTGGGLQRVAAPGPAASASAAPAADAAAPYAPFLKGPGLNQPSVMNDVEKELFMQRSKDDESSAREYRSKTVVPEAAAAAEGREAIRAQAALLKQDPNLTGAGKEGIAAVANWLVSMKLATPDMAKNVSDVQSFDAFVKKAMLAEQTRQHGVQTEGDAQRILQAVASMGKTPQANHFIMRYLDAVASRTQQRAQFFQQYQQANGGRLAGAQDRWLEYIHANPLVREVPGAKGKVILFEPEYLEYMKSRGAQRSPQT